MPGPLREAPLGGAMVSAFGFYVWIQSFDPDRGRESSCGWEVKLWSRVVHTALPSRKRTLCYVDKCVDRQNFRELNS